MYRCTVSGCKNEAIFDTNICDDCLQELNLLHLANYGAPETVECGECGKTFSLKEFDKHPCKLMYDFLKG